MKCGEEIRVRDRGFSHWPVINSGSGFLQVLAFAGFGFSRIWTQVLAQVLAQILVSALGARTLHLQATSSQPDPIRPIICLLMSWAT